MEGFILSHHIWSICFLLPFDISVTRYGLISKMMLFGKHTFKDKLFYMKHFHLNLVILLVCDFPKENLYYMERNWFLIFRSIWHAYFIFTIPFYLYYLQSMSVGKILNLVNNPANLYFSTHRVTLLLIPFTIFTEW